ncbi:MAG: polyprenol monophosphomannose synthase [Chloroflexota bacterium]|nr:polyprenol monophosphomannose synthase [Chloroflexota bacterium]
MKITVVVPTYNEAENLPKLASALFFLPLSSLHLLVVDDNSPDGTGQVADDLAKEYPGRVSVLHRLGKQGLGTAYLAGFARALDDGAEIIVQMDADFSHNPERIDDLVGALQDSDMALGSRYIPGGKLDENWPLWRKALSYFGNMYARLILDIPVKDITGGFRAWRRETLAGMPLERVKSNGYGFQVEMIYLAHMCGYNVKEIPIYFADRCWGESKMSLSIQLEAAVRVWAIRFSGIGAKKHHD